MNAQTKRITRSDERMHTQIDWLDGWHSFSFGQHYDPERVSFGALRVVNDDIIAPGGGFAPHPHRDMEIVTVVLDGQLEHKDSMGNGRIIQAGEVQYMSAGSGVTHSEFNPSADKPVHLMQIWITPDAKGYEPRYADQPLAATETNDWTLIFSPDGRDASMTIRQDAELRTAELEAGTTIDYAPRVAQRGLWLFVIDGDVGVAGETLGRADSIGLSGIESISIHSETGAKVLLFDVPMV